MKIRTKKWFAISLLILATLACNLGAPAETVPTAAPTAAPAVPATPTTPPAQPGTDPTPPPTQPQQGMGLSDANRQRLASATVLILMLEDRGGDLVPFGSGSGTIITPDGLILTNAHVANPAAQGNYEYQPDALGIALMEQEDKPPIVTYLAEVKTVDGLLDLAVIQITANLDGSRVSPGDLNLPFVELGDSDQIHLGDALNIFGFPGIGGDTITFTKGSISGFSTQDPVGDRAWVKTDATIAGGNSGGLGASDAGQIVGVPTIVASGGAADVTDCRVIQDTNGDGQLTSEDTCIPVGGFINALRPVNLAKPLIRAAQSGVAYESPYTPGGSSSVPSSGDEIFTFVNWSVEYDDNGCSISPVTAFGSGVEQVTAIYSFSGMTAGQRFGLTWLIDEEKVYEDTFNWEHGDSDSCFPFWLANGGEAMPEGDYTLLLFAGDDLHLVDEVVTTVGGTGMPQQSGGGGIQVDGYVTDADTGNDISGAVIIILNSGTDVDNWLDNGTDDDIFTWAETDSQGYYQFPALFERDVEYPAIAGASSQGYQNTDGYILFDDTDGDTVTINIELSQ